MSRVALLCGSRKPPPGGTTVSAAREMLREVAAGIRATGHEQVWIDLRELELPWWDGRTGAEYGCADLDRLCALLSSCRAVVVSAPCYWDALSGVVKNMLDLTGPDPWRSTLVAGLVVGMNESSACHGEDQLRQVVNALGAWWAPYAFVVGNPREHHDPSELRRELRRFGGYVGLTLNSAPWTEPAGEGGDGRARDRAATARTAAG